ncbi:MAG: hypothetical protein NV67_10185, partial [Gammaproteobacteria bacterium (ex Lamellibrachia satsuma)]
ARDEQVKLAAERKTQLEQANQARVEQVKLANERQIQIEQLTKARDEQVKLAAECKAQLEQANKIKADKEKLANDQNFQLEVLSKEKSVLELQVESFNKSLSQQQAKEVQLQQEITETRQALNLSVKLQTLRENDLKDLQIRYQEAAETQENQHQLLVKLSERLSAASSYLHQLNTKKSNFVMKNNKKKKLKAKKKRSKRKKLNHIADITIDKV